MNKLEKIDMLLENDKSFEEYISSIEKMEMSVPVNLEKNICSKINHLSKYKKDTKVYKFKFQDILKIVACTIFAVAMWQFTLSKPIDASQKDSRREERNQVYDKIDGFMKNVNDFFMEPRNMKGDKK